MLRRNGLTLVFLGLFVVFWLGHALAGWRHENEERREHGEPAVALTEYLASGTFWESTAENWESEFLQMAAFIWLTVFLRQRGSSQSRDAEETGPGAEPRPRPDSPGPVHRGGLALKLYSHSLSLTLLALFLFSFGLHAVSGHAAYDEEQARHGMPRTSIAGYLGSSRFWFESFQNWQSEFLAVASIVVLSIFLRERGSPESKPVEASHSETGG